MFTVLVYGSQRYTVLTEYVPQILRLAPWLKIAKRGPFDPGNDNGTDRPVLARCHALVA